MHEVINWKREATYNSYSSRLSSVIDLLMDPLRFRINLRLHHPSGIARADQGQEASDEALPLPGDRDHATAGGEVFVVEALAAGGQQHRRHAGEDEQDEDHGDRAHAANPFRTIVRTDDHRRPVATAQPRRPPRLSRPSRPESRRMTLAALGPHRFALAGVPIASMARTSAPRADSPPVVGGLPVRHVTGIAPTKLTLEATFYPRAMPGRGLATLEAMARAAL
jgi:hypothetical protein